MTTADPALKASLSLSPSGFLYDARTAESYTLNATGQRLVAAMLAGEGSRDIWRRLVEDFEVTELRARRDTAAFLAHLRLLRLLEPSSAESNESK